MDEYIPNKQIWTLGSFDSSFCKSYLTCFTRSSAPVQFQLGSIIYTGKVPSKIKTFIWSLVLQILNKNDICQVHKSTSFNICVCKQNDETYYSHLLFAVLLFRFFGALLLECRGRRELVLPQWMELLLTIVVKMLSRVRGLPLQRLVD